MCQIFEEMRRSWISSTLTLLLSVDPHTRAILNENHNICLISRFLYWWTLKFIIRVQYVHNISFMFDILLMWPNFSRQIAMRFDLNYVPKIIELVTVRRWIHQSVNYEITCDLKPIDLVHMNSWTNILLKYSNSRKLIKIELIHFLHFFARARN